MSDELRDELAGALRRWIPGTDNTRLEPSRFRAADALLPIIEQRIAQARAETATRKISLTQGYVALVDAADYDDLSQHLWFVHFKGSVPYAARADYSSGKKRYELMHRRLLPDAPYVDHIDGDGLDNRRSNLRAATHSQNLRNRVRLGTNNKSGFRGVSWHVGNKVWQAQIYIEGKKKHLGSFANREDAARAFDDAAVEHYGEFHGRLNFPDQDATSIARQHAEEVGNDDE